MVFTDSAILLYVNKNGKRILNSEIRKMESLSPGIRLAQK
ncbi:hypothetical protein ASZ90_006432 [hydrocarbon metagenome]|uniref:Uncharacterized protein n=1 Tax=hydrocarbon metagenome TaxID=938273 RepID=A0A0W8FSH2_9ZZZZ